MPFESPPLSRRTLLLAVAGTACWPAVSAAATPSFAGSSTVLLHQRGLAPSHRFKAAWHGPVADVLGFDGDVGELLHPQRVQRWSVQATALSGLTSAVAFFCLQHLAADRGWRVVGQRQHRPGDDAAHAANAMALQQLDPAGQRALPLGAPPVDADALVSWLLLPRHRITGAASPSASV